MEAVSEDKPALTTCMPYGSIIMMSKHNLKSMFMQAR